MTDSGEPELRQLLKEMAVLLQKYGMGRYQSGFRAGMDAAEKRIGKEIFPRPPPPPKEALKPRDHTTPLHPVEWPYEHKRGLR